MARLSPGRVLMVKAVPTSRPERWNGLSPKEPASRARLSEMMEVGATLNASIRAAGGLATEAAAMVTLMSIDPPSYAALPGRAFSRVRMARQGAVCPSHSGQSDWADSYGGKH